MSSFSFTSNHTDYNPSLQNAQPALSQQNQQQQNHQQPNQQQQNQQQHHHITARKQSYPSPQIQQSPQIQMQRRESLVKPTWQNVCPGEVPIDTLEKLNQLSNGEQTQILQQYNQPLQQYQRQQQQHHQLNHTNCESPATSTTNTLQEKINKIGDFTAGIQANNHGHSTSSTGGNGGLININDNQILLQASKQRRQVDLFDIGGKVRRYDFKFHLLFCFDNAFDIQHMCYGVYVFAC